jgi:hypothetical protein
VSGRVTLSRWVDALQNNPWADSIARWVLQFIALALPLANRRFQGNLISVQMGCTIR